ncbi:hypothetical protein MPAR168_22230 [Methylorubrum populi]
MFVQSGSLNLIDSSFTNNTAVGGTGGGSLDPNDFNNKGAGGSGGNAAGAIYVQPGASVTSSNLTFVNNVGTGGAGGTAADPDGPQGTGYEISNDPSVVCFVIGTLIRTAAGDKSVEDLAIGDFVVTASGEHRPIKWIGTRSYIGRFANANPGILPICFKAGALADGIPARDLRVSPKHAMFLDGCLIPAASLVNGASIVKEQRVEELTYFHIELESHDVLIAEGAASESFVDDNGRGIFHNAHTFATMYPNEQRVTAVYCAPRVEHGFVLEAVRQRLNARAGLQVSVGSRFGELRGVIEGCDGTRVWGWAQDQAYLDAPVCLDVLVDGQVVSLVYADKPTAEHGAHGFTINLPETLSETATVAVRRSADRAMLASLMHSIPSVQAAA